MTAHRLAALSTAAILLGSGSALAQADTTALVDDILTDFVGYEFTEVSIRRGFLRTRVTAEGGGVEVTRIYDRDGALLRETVEDGDTEIERRYDLAGVLLFEELGHSILNGCSLGLPMGVIEIDRVRT